MLQVNNPIQLMLDEHEMISSTEKVVKQLDKYWESSEDAFKQHMKSLLIFFREYSDKYHHFKEEQVLFPEMQNLNDFAVSSIIGELLEHHEIFREHLTTIERFLDNQYFEKAYQLLCTYMNELLDHIAAENDEVFVMAESLFSETELETMYFKFIDIDAELGDNKKAELCSLLKDIELGMVIN
jgi:hemerythrin-like domain-containing protein